MHAYLAFIGTHERSLVLAVCTHHIGAVYHDRPLGRRRAALRVPARRNRRGVASSHCCSVALLHRRFVAALRCCVVACCKTDRVAADASLPCACRRRQPARTVMQHETLAM
jgi:hypothetical protein